MTYAIVELTKEGGYTVIKKGEMLSDLVHTAIDGEFFPSVFVSRDDLFATILRDLNLSDEYSGSPLMQDELRAAKEKIDAISEEDMIHMANKLQDHLVEYGGYWDWLREWVDRQGITINAKE